MPLQKKPIQIYSIKHIKRLYIICVYKEQRDTTAQTVEWIKSTNTWQCELLTDKDTGQDRSCWCDCKVNISSSKSSWQCASLLWCDRDGILSLWFLLKPWNFKSVLRKTLGLNWRTVHCIPDQCFLTLPRSGEWRDGSAIKNACYFCRVPMSGSQPPC